MRKRLIGSCLIRFIWAFTLRCFSVGVCCLFACGISAVLEQGETLLLRYLHCTVLSLCSVGIHVWVPGGSGYVAQAGNPEPDLPSPTYPTVLVQVS